MLFYIRTEMVYKKILTVIIIGPVAGSRTRERLERLTVIDFLKLL